MQDVIKINQEDNVAVALRPIAKGETLDIAGTPVTTLEEIPQGHKVAIKPIAQGGNVIKYGFRIGIAKEDIKVGQWVHVHNIKTALGDLLTYEYEPTNPSVTETEHEPPTNCFSSTGPKRRRRSNDTFYYSNT